MGEQKKPITRRTVWIEEVQKFIAENRKTIVSRVHARLKKEGLLRKQKQD